MAESENKIMRYPLKQNIGYIGTMGILFLVLGLIVSIQTRRQIEAEKSRIPETRQLNELVLLLKETQNKKSLLEKQLAQIQQQIHKANSESLPPSLSSPQFQKLYQIAGLTAIKGRGIIVNLEDARSLNKSNNDPARNNLLENDGLVHSDDLLKVVNELKAAGATAISVNNQRLVTTSEIVTSGNNIMVNQTRLIPPYVIKAIGPADTMMSALKMRGGIIEYLEVFGIKVNINVSSDINIPPYTGSLS